ncbi:MAG: helix-turn-helix transcriptional regulator, partial [Chloroflexota bacterium]
MKYLKDLRKLTGLTQEQFADAIDIGRTYLNQLEVNEDKQPSDELRLKIGEVVFMRLVVPVRRMMSDAARMSDGSAAIDRIKKLEIRGDLSERRALLLDILDSSKPPVIVAADWAVKLFEANIA